MDPIDRTAQIKLIRSEPYQRLLSTLSEPTAKKNIDTASRNWTETLLVPFANMRAVPMVAALEFAWP
jgi:hypothetical protein